MKNAEAAVFIATAVLLLLCQCDPTPTKSDNGNGDDEENGAGSGIPDIVWYTNNPNETVFEISTADELAGLALLVNDSSFNFAGKTVKLTGSIDISKNYGETYEGGLGWTGIGTQANPFRGTFDGNGKEINGLYINAKDYSSAGLFGVIDDGAVIKNLGLIITRINGNSTIGGIVGRVVRGRVITCYAKGTIQGKKNVGGVAGAVDDGEISGCYFIGSINGSGDNIGGIVGSIDISATVKNCYSHDGTISGSSEIGGVVGYINGDGIVTACYSTVSVSGSSSDVGGIVGSILNNSSITNCAALNKSVKSSNNMNVGRIVGDPGTAILSGNIAFSAMEGGAAWDNEGGDKIDGADITKGTINSDGTLVGLFNSADGWTTQSGKLPGLGGSAVEMPDHLKP